MIEVIGWEKFQAFRDREPKWIKLHRSLLGKREWRELNPSAAKLLIDIWLLLAERGERKGYQFSGKLDMSLEDIAWHLRLDTIEPDFSTLAEKGFVQSCTESNEDVSQRRVEREKEKSTELQRKRAREASFSAEGQQLNEERQTSEVGTDEGESLEVSPASQSQAVQVTDSELRHIALQKLGMGAITRAHEQMAVNREIQEMLQNGISRENLRDAMLGLALLRDRGECGFDDQRPITPGFLRAYTLKGKKLWYGEGDRRTEREIFDLCQEVWRLEDDTDIGVAVQLRSI